MAAWLDRMRRPGVGVAFSAVFLAYALVFATTRADGLGMVVVATLRNGVSLLLTASAAWRLLDQWEARLNGAGLWLHALVAALFSVLWLWLLTIAAAIGAAGSPVRFAVAPFLFGPAAEWQLLQGLFAYAALAAVHRLRAVQTVAQPVAPTAPASPRATLLVKVGDEIVSVVADEIVAITGADDYAELTTTTRRHLVRTTLTEFTEQLDDQRFMRIHRSAIVNLARIVRAEPAGGGRMTVHLERGLVLAASRTGARALRTALA